MIPSNHAACVTPLLGLHQKACSRLRRQFAERYDFASLGLARLPTACLTFPLFVRWPKNGCRLPATRCSCDRPQTAQWVTRTRTSIRLASRLPPHPPPSLLWQTMPLLPALPPPLPLPRSRRCFCFLQWWLWALPSDCICSPPKNKGVGSSATSPSCPPFGRLPIDRETLTCCICIAACIIPLNNSRL